MGLYLESYCDSCKAHIPPGRGYEEPIFCEECWEQLERTKEDELEELEDEIEGLKSEIEELKSEIEGYKLSPKGSWRETLE